MADFCKQCTEELFQVGHNDLSNLVSAEEEAEGYMATVLCEGCGPIQVNREGKCLSHDCDKKHGPQASPPDNNAALEAAAKEVRIEQLRVALRAAQRKLDRTTSLRSYLLSRYTAADKTMIKDVKKRDDILDAINKEVNDVGQ